MRIDINAYIKKIYNPLPEQPYMKNVLVVRDRVESSGKYKKEGVDTYQLKEDYLGKEELPDLIEFYGCYDEYDDPDRLCKVEWRKEGLNLHRENDKPAVIEFHTSGKVREMIWYKNGDFHRDGDKPAWIDYTNKNNIARQSWYKDGKRHRDGDKPAYIEYYDDGQTVRQQIWYQNGKINRDDYKKPSSIEYHSNGSVKTEEWHVQSKMYKTVSYDRNGYQVPYYLD